MEPRRDESQPPRHPAVVVAVLNFNSKDHLEYCLPTVQAQDYAHVRPVVVDNASVDGSAAWIRQNHPRIAVIELRKNDGMAGLNAVLDWDGLGDAEFILFMTNDVMLDRRCVSHAVDIATTDPSVGIIGFSMLGALSWVDPALLEAASMQVTAARAREVECVQGAAMFCRRRLLEVLGPIDPAYFAYCEEDDLQQRVLAAGYRLVALDTPVWHNAGRNAFSKLPRTAAYLQMRNVIRYVTKIWGIRRGLAQAAVVAYKALWPGLRVDRSQPYEYRQRPFSPLRNLPVVFRAIGWNVIHLGETLAARRDALSRIGRAQRTGGKSNPT